MGTNKLEGRVALVTGAGSGIGRAIAARFLQEGAAVALLEQDEEAGRDAADELGAYGRVLFHALDVADESAVKAALTEVTRWGQGLDCVVNNAGHFAAFGT